MIEGNPSSKSRLINKIKFFLPSILSLGILLFFIIYLSRNLNRYSQLLEISPDTILLSIGLILSISLIHGLVNYSFFRAMGIVLTINEGIGLAAVNTLANQLPLSGGLIAKGFYLKQKHRLAYTHFISATMALYVCFVAVNGTVALIVSAYLLLSTPVTVPLSLVLGFSAMALSATSLWFPINTIRLSGIIGTKLQQLAKGWNVLKKNQSVIALMVMFQTLTILLFAGRLWITFHALSQDVSYAQCILFSSATVLTRLINIVPGGIGVREGIVAGIASILGLAADVSAIAVALDRLISTPVIIVFGVIYTYILSKRATNGQPEHSNQ